MRKILLLCPYPVDLAPSQRFRYEQYLGHLKKTGYAVVIHPFLSQKAYAILGQSGNFISKIHAITHSYCKRFALLLHARRFDFIFIHREASPAGPPIIEWILAKLLIKKIIYDFDDAIWLTDKVGESPLSARIRWRSKVGSICRWSYKVSCGNNYLAQYSLRFNPAVVINPTTIDTENGHRPMHGVRDSKKSVTIGWTGSRTTLKYIKTLLPVLTALEVKHPNLKFLVIADEDPKLPLTNVTFVRWNRETEIVDLAAMDIGIMPLPDDEWTRGKCGFKALQYMAMGIPAVVSPVGVNREIVRNGLEGFWCTSPHEWFVNLEALILNPEKRKEMGELGRQKVIANYSVSSNVAKFLSLFQ